MDQTGHPTVAFSSATRAAFRSATRSMGLRPVQHLGRAFRTGSQAVSR